MKKFIYIAILMLIPLGVAAQSDSDSKSNQIYENPEVTASFPGGNAALVNWLSQNIKYPASARKNNIEGRVIVRFIVEKNGRISEVKVVRSIDPALDLEAVRVVKAMPHWTPAQFNGIAVRSRFILPINFKK
ncbi:MAG: energy transducer TonB [Prevotella sp.]|nr:energy transducer TonB [Prevotella sp.]